MLKGKNAVITGCSGGIGAAAVEVFARNGANVWACTRQKTNEFQEYCQKIQDKYKCWVKPVYFDLQIEEEVVAGAKEIIADKMPIDILINNAGTVPKSSLFQMAGMEEMKRTFQVNYFSNLLFTQYISRKMVRNKKGSIVNVSSVSALDGGPAQIEYVSSKAAIDGATKRLAIELGEYGIRVNSVAPGIIDTNMLDNMKEEIQNQVIAHSILKRKGTPEEVGNLLCFLASDLSSYITGQTIRADGGTLR